MVGSIDDFPIQNPAQPIQDGAEAAFEAALQATRLFSYQRKDRNDYGSDYQLEVIDGSARTNVRIHVQLKGTTDPAKADGSTSVTVARRNLNYLLTHSDSLYVCHRSSDGTLLARPAEDVYSHYEQAVEAWKNQETITVRFTEAFDDTYQRRLHALALARSRASRDDRLEWAATPPERLAAVAAKAVPRITVPGSAGPAATLLRELYESGNDAQISRSFDQFRAVIGDAPPSIDWLYMSEINLGLNDKPFSVERVRDALRYFGTRDTVQPRITPTSIAYAVGNAHLALKQHEDAAASFRAAIAALNKDAKGIGAQCWKNLGAALEASGDWEQARGAFETALTFNPDLAEAHMALGLWHRKHSKDLHQSIEHLDLVSTAPGSAVTMRPVNAWRAAALFELDDTNAAFAAIDAVVGSDLLDAWEWPWCARLVRAHGKKSTLAATQALKFWRKFLKFHSGSVVGITEAFTCAWLLHERGVDTRLDFDQFKAQAKTLMASPGVDAALVWDRVGHWAKTDGDWVQAEAAFHRAFELKPDRYAHCLAVTLNHLGRYEDALAALLPLTKTPDVDSPVWFQIAFSQERVGNIQAAAEGYRRAIELEPGYALAHFNLGGVLWNDRNLPGAISAWSEAVARFPEHELTAKLQKDFPDIFGFVAAKSK